ncbi:MAG: ABC transporter ATP-binding protein [Treponema sp.]|nr:ABC transporter ATP-binding protein [Treponema sp.]MEE3434998.1 ABC transporter ATP-binding protein [Treponema sp.]
MADNDIAIKVENLSKYYKLGVINNGTLFRDIQSWWARVRGKEDPHAKIGSKCDPTKEGFWALKDLNFEIKKGDRVGIIGHNGAGKSTLLKLLSQITAPTEGSIKINGKIASLLEVGTGFHPEMTGRENIYMNGAILGMSHDEIDKKVNDIIEFSEIGEHIDTPVKRYSSGMYVRLAFAVAAHLDSDILIADEVLAVGDAAFQKKALGKMNELSSGEGRTVLFVSHNMAQVKNLCNKGIVLKNGTIVRQNNDIDESIDYYLKNGIENEQSEDKVINWYNDGSIKNDYMTPMCIEILDSNKRKENNSLSFDKQYYISFKFNVKQKSIKPVCNFLRVMSGDVCISSFSMPLKSYEPGEYGVLYTIKPAQLPPGVYRLVLESSIWETEWIVNDKYNEVVVLFQVSNSENYSKMFMGEIFQV